MPSLSVALAVLLLSGGSSQQPAAAREQLVVSTAWLAQHLNDADLVLLHVGDKAEYDTRHLPNARYVALRDLSAAPAEAGGLTLEMLPRDRLRERLEALGISDGSRVVVYYGKDWISPATRVIFTLDYAGLDRVSLLDGGMEAWAREGRPVTDAAPPTAAGKLQPLQLRALVVDADFVRSHLAAPGFAVVDARDPSYYLGKQTGGAKDHPHKTGHIAGARSIPFSSLAGDDLKLKSTAELADAFARAGVKPQDTVITYCHIGQQATATLFAARRLEHKVLLYDGSFEDWSRRDYPVENPSQAPGDTPAATQPPAGAWRREPEMRTGRAAHAVAATTNGIYVFAGTGADGKPVLDVERFDGKQWNREAALPGEGLNAPAAAVVGDAIYLTGGFGTTTNRPTASVRRYDVKTRTWSEAAPLPAPRGGHSAVVLDGKIHVIGGGNSVSTIADHSVYDPGTDKWSELAPLPRAMGSPAAVVFEGRLYSIGGRSGPTDFGDVYVYDQAANKWSSGPPIEPRGTAGAVALAGAIYLFGGESQAKKAVLDGVLRLDRGATSWVAAGKVPTARNYARAVVFNGSVYIVGGSTEYGAGHSSHGSPIVESFHPPGR